LKRAPLLLLCAPLLLVGMAFVHPFGNARVVPVGSHAPLLGGVNEDARRVLVTKCADCHSNETRWPVYARVAPGSWLIERDVVEGRRKMNLSNWDGLSADDKAILVGKIVHEARTGEMPLLQYRLVHWGAELKPQDISALATMGGASHAASVAVGAGDKMRGAAVFAKRCVSCHGDGGGREGPPLSGGVFGKKAGTVPSFAYSNGLKQSGIVWNEVTLEKWLADPDLVVPDNKMDFHVPSAQERLDLVAYLKR